MRIFQPLISIIWVGRDSRISVMHAHWNSNIDRGRYDQCVITNWQPERLDLGDS
jgi:hypothetical protein